jgi:hypothetical protein
MCKLIVAVSVFLAAAAAAADMPICYKTSDPTVVTGVNKTTPGAGEVCFAAPFPGTFKLAHLKITWDGETPTVSQKSQAEKDAADLSAGKMALKNRLKEAYKQAKTDADKPLDLTALTAKAQREWKTFDKDLRTAYRFAKAQIAAARTLTELQAIAWDFTTIAPPEE